MTLTQSSVHKASAKIKPYEIRDKKLQGFLVRVQPSGQKTYYCEYRRGARVKIGQHSIFDVKSARVQARDILLSYHQGENPALIVKRNKESYTYKEFLEEHYFTWVDANHKSAKETKRRLTVDCATFANKKLDEITPRIVEKWRIAKIARGNSAQTANRCFAYLRASLSKAEEWGIIEEHPFRKMKLIKTEKNNIVRYLSVNEEKRLRDALESREGAKRQGRVSANKWREQRHKPLYDDMRGMVYIDHLKPMILLSMNTGLRRGEVFSLKWKNVDFDLRQITVEAADAKSRKSRHIPLNEEAYSVMVNWKSQCENSQGYVFTNKVGGRFTDTRKSWCLLLKQAEITSFRWHDLRHHFASKLAIAGVNLNTIRSLLGHSSYAITLRYAHLSEEHKADAVAMLNIDE